MEYIDINSISALHAFHECEKPLHPLISVLDLPRVHNPYARQGEVSYRMGFYTVSCKKFTGELRYGRSTYDFSDGTLAFTAPRQVLTPSPDAKIIEGWALYIHPDFLLASERGKALTTLSYFGYEINEALHVSDAEKTVLKECLNNIRREITQNIDNHTYNVILGNLELLFAYCTRFYDRQFLTRTRVGNDILQKFERMLNDYFAGETTLERGLPDVKYFAAGLNLSPNYLSDLLNKLTGKTTQEHIHLKLIDQAKSLLWSTDKSVSEIAYVLGFEHPSHFTKLFKSKTGAAPREFRKMN